MKLTETEEKEIYNSFIKVAQEQGKVIIDMLNEQLANTPEENKQDRDMLISSISKGIIEEIKRANDTLVKQLEQGI